MNVVQRRPEKIVTMLRLILILLPVVSFLISVWSWLRYGVDIPVYDDWRQYNANEVGLLNLDYLFTPHNDTLYTLGLLLDSLAFRFLDGNTVAYQFLSLVFVLGGLLLLQWKLLKRYCADKTCFAVAFSFTLLMLQPDTYWGWSNLAYHQAIPLVCVLGILMLATSKTQYNSFTPISIACLGLISGLSYISGAFAALSICSISILYGLLSKSEGRKNILKAGLALLIPAIATTFAQLWVIVEVQHGTHRADAPMAFPWESDFWLFMLGKVARSLMLPIDHPTLSMAVTLIAVAAIVFVSFKSLTTITNKTTPQLTEPLYIFLSLCAAIFLYLTLISAGRTNLRPDEVDAPLEIFKYGFYRFHFFWVTLLWPWLAYIIFNWLQHKARPKSLAFIVTALLSLAWVAACIYTPIIKNNEFFKTTMLQRINGLNCINEKIQKTGPVNCVEISQGDIAEGISNGRSHDASFARLMRITPIPLGTDAPRPDYRMSENLNTLKVTNAQKLSNNTPLRLRTDRDSNLNFLTSEDLSSCRTLNISARMTSTADSIAQLFYLLPSDSGFSEAHSMTARVVGSDEPQQVNFTINSPTGFKQELRFDPVTEMQDITISEIEVRCRSHLVITQ
ncbi:MULTISPECIES: hypothetical protein [Pseudomonas syringae group]|nr:hypothetical protein [Pseudomonas viridiflava]MBD8567416.1 hypothetical protein [Pseudomonas syringae]MBD8806733.1 hypothetical protein [Pseudomonas syringae]MEE4100671.1 hypothetical protein [Pseudomonas viridiflava]